MFSLAVTCPSHAAARSQMIALGAGVRRVRDDSWQNLSPNPGMMKAAGPPDQIHPPPPKVHFIIWQGGNARIKGFPL